MREIAVAAQAKGCTFVDGGIVGPPSRVAGTTVDRAVGELALEICGTDAMADGSFADANFRMSMTAGVAVGATEIQLNLIASRILHLPKE